MKAQVTSIAPLGVTCLSCSTPTLASRIGGIVLYLFENRPQHEHPHSPPSAHPEWVNVSTITAFS